MANLAVKLQALDGTWETIGVERYPGIVPEGFTASSNEWGFDTCSFTLRRPTDLSHPDLSAYTPCEVYVGGIRVWEGRVRETPTQEGADSQINVTGVGWQAQLDDDQYERIYVQSDLAVWRDVRSLLSADLTMYRAFWSVEAGSGAVLLQIPQGATFTSLSRGGVMLDFGPEGASWCKRVVVTLESVANLTANETLVVRNHDLENSEAAGVTTEAATLGATPPVAGTYAATFTTPRRYVSLYYQLASGAGTGTAGADKRMRITSLLAFSDTAFESGNASILKASTVMQDALSRACPLLSSDYSGIDATSFNIPDLAPDGPKTVRDVASAVNAFHRWRAKLVTDRRFLFSAQPNAPVVKVGDWPGARFQNTAAGSGEEIYNRVLVTGTKPDGSPLRVERVSAQTSAYETAWARAVSGSGSSAAGTTLTSGYPKKGCCYALAPTVISTSALMTLKIRVGVTTDAADAFLTNAAAGDWIEFTVTGNGTITLPSPAAWRPKLTAQIARLAVDTVSGAGTYTVGAEIRRGITLVDRREFTRTKQLPVSASLDDAGGSQVGDVFLFAHQRTPLKGPLTVDGAGGVRAVHGDESVHPAELLLKSTELVRMSNHVDPDTGGLGRDGVIASATYTHDSESATVQIDNDRTSLDALLARLAAVTGSRA